MCGIFGYCGSVPADLQKMKILGIFNESRGKHSCGISINKKIRWGVNKKSLFKDFIIDTPLSYTRNQRDFTVLGHTRQSTYGAHSQSMAHPFGFTKDKEGKWSINEENTKYNFIGVHNGRLDEWRKLREHLGLDSKIFDLDSKILLGALVQDLTNPKILEIYDGDAAVMVIDTSEKNTLYLYKGGGLTGNREERPLFFWQARSGKKISGTYVSSIKDSLLAISEGKGEVNSLVSNTLFKLQNGLVVDKIEIERKPKTFPTTNFSHGKQADFPSDSGQSCGSYNSRRGNSSINRNLYSSLTFKDLDNDMETTRKEGQVYVHCLRYMLGKGLLNGVFQLDNNGFVCEKKEGKTYHFINGIMINSSSDFKEATLLVEKTLKNTGRIYPFEISRYSKYPLAYTGLDGDILPRSSTPYCYYRSNVFSGIVHPLFSTKEYTMEYSLPTKVKFNSDIPLTSEIIKEKSATIERIVLMNSIISNKFNIIDKKDDKVTSALPEKIEKPNKVVNIGKVPPSQKGDKEILSIFGKDLQDDLSILSDLVKDKVKEYVNIMELDKDHPASMARLNYAKLVVVDFLLSADRPMKILSAIKLTKDKFFEYAKPKEVNASSDNGVKQESTKK